MTNGIRSVAVILVLAATTALPSSAQWYKSYQDGVDAIHSQQWQEAIAKLNDAIAQKSDSKARARTYGVMNFIDYFPYVYRGLAEYRLGEEAKALADFEKEEAQGEVHRASDDREAEKILGDNLALLKKSTVADTRFEEGRKLYKQGDYQKAIDAFRAVPKSSASWSAASKYIEMAQAELNKASSRQTASSQKHLIESNFKEGMQQYNRKNYAAAEERFNAVLALDANHANAKRYLSRIRSTRGKQEGEQQPRSSEIAGATELSGDQAAFQEAVHLFDSGMPGKAREKFLALQTTNPSYPEVRTYLEKITQAEEKIRQGISSYFGGQYQQAIEQLSEATKSNNEDGHMYAALACAYATKFLLTGGEDKGLYQNALEAIRKARQMGNIQLDGRYISPKIIALLNPR